MADDRTPPPVPPAAPVQLDAHTAWSKGYERGRLDGLAAGVAAGRKQAAADIEADWMKRAETACCGGTGLCGSIECQIASAVDSALCDAAARIAEESNRAD